MSLAEKVGFEPTLGIHLNQISSLAHSTTLPPLLIRSFLYYPESSKAHEYSRCIFIRKDQIESFPSPFAVPNRITMLS
jgi:hypothetical protein